MHDLETLAQTEPTNARRELAAMQALALRLLETGGADARLRPLARALSRDLEAALAGRAEPWSEARTRFEARKLARLAPETAEAESHDTDQAPEPVDHYDAEPEPSAEERKRKILIRLAIALVAAALWAAWIASLGRSGSVAWDGGTGPAQTQNLFFLYGPAVLALLVTLIAINPPHEDARA